VRPVQLQVFLKCFSSHLSSPALRLPGCFCSEDGRGIPGGLAPQDTPQMIVLTFDDAVNINNYDVMETVLNENLVNPNGCSAKATFFVSHRYTNYSMVQVCLP
jgi:hypothetical protein